MDYAALWNRQELLYLSQFFFYFFFWGGGSTIPVFFCPKNVVYQFKSSKVTFPKYIFQELSHSQKTKVWSDVCMYSNV